MSRKWRTLLSNFMFRLTFFLTWHLFSVMLCKISQSSSVGLQYVWTWEKWRDPPGWDIAGREGTAGLRTLSGSGEGPGSEPGVLPPAHLLLPHHITCFSAHRQDCPLGMSQIPGHTLRTTRQSGLKDLVLAPHVIRGCLAVLRACSPVMSERKTARGIMRESLTSKHSSSLAEQWGADIASCPPAPPPAKAKSLWPLSWDFHED